MEDKRTYTFNQAIKFIEKNDLENFKKLDDINIKNHINENLLMYACKNNNLDFIKYIIENKLLDINSLNKESLNCLYYINYETEEDENNVKNILNFLIENNIDVFKPTQRKTNIFLHIRDKINAYEKLNEKLVVKLKSYFTILLNSYEKYLINNINDKNFVDVTVFNIYWCPVNTIDRLIKNLNLSIDYCIRILSKLILQLGEVNEICEDINCFKINIENFTSAFKKFINNYKKYFKINNHALQFLIKICNKKYDGYDKLKYKILINNIINNIQDLIKNLKDTKNIITNNEKVRIIKNIIIENNTKVNKREELIKNLLEEEEKEEKKKENEKLKKIYSTTDLTSDLTSDLTINDLTSNDLTFETKIDDKALEWCKDEEYIKTIRKKFFNEDNITFNDDNKAIKGGYTNPKKMFEYIIFNYIKDYLIYIISKIDDKFKLILYGGACVEYYSKGKYKTNDLDFKLYSRDGIVKTIDEQVNFLKDKVLPYISLINVEEILKKPCIDLTTDKVIEGWKHSLISTKDISRFKYTYDDRGIIKISISDLHIIDINLYKDETKKIEAIEVNLGKTKIYVVPKDKLIENYNRIYNEYKHYIKNYLEEDLEIIKPVNNINFDNIVRYIGEKAKKYLEILGVKIDGYKKRSLKRKSSLRKKSKKRSLKRKSKKRSFRRKSKKRSLRRY